MASSIPKGVKKEIIDGWLTETWKACLLTNAYAWLESHLLYTDVSGSEIVGTGYTAGGATLTLHAWNVVATGYVDTVNATIDADDVAWTTATFTGANAPRWIVVYETTGGAIRAFYDLGTTYPVTAGTFTIQWNPAGMIKIS